MDGASARVFDGDASNDDQERVNAEFWARGDTVAFYASLDMRPVETVLLERHRAALEARVLELGCGAGRLTGHLCALSDAVHGLDLSPLMIAHCKRTYPQATFSVGDLRDLSAFGSGSFEAVVAPFNVLDVLGDPERRRVLSEVHRVLGSDGLLVFSSHNRGWAPTPYARFRSLLGSPRHPLASLKSLPRRLRNRRRMRRLEREESGYALVNDEAHDFSILHYYIDRDAQAKQLAELGFDFVECLDLDGREVPACAAAPSSPELHYVARAKA